MALSKPQRYRPISPEGLSQAEYLQKLKEERDGWRHNACLNAASAYEEHEARRRQEPPADPREARLWYEMSEDRRERALGIPEGADPIQVMVYLDERAKKHPVR